MTDIKICQTIHWCMIENQLILWKNIHNYKHFTTRIIMCTITSFKARKKNPEWIQLYVLAKTSGPIPEGLRIGAVQGQGAGFEGGTKRINISIFQTETNTKYFNISIWPGLRSGAGCVLEDTELVGGDIPAILGGGGWTDFLAFLFFGIEFVAILGSSWTLASAH